MRQAQRDNGAMPLMHSAFYRFVPLDDPEAVAARLRVLACGLVGYLLLAREGLNGVIAGTPDQLDAFENALVRGDDPVFADAFAGMPFKRSACRTRPFGRLKVSVKREIVALGLPADAPEPTTSPADETVVAPADWDALIARPDVVLLDNRNHFEVRLGRFAGARDPGVDLFSDFAAHVMAEAPRWQAEGKTVAMYCTGGIRCEKSAPWMRALGLTVKQLDGGILGWMGHHAATGQPTTAWEGELFVFDNRVALDTALDETPTTAAQVYDAAREDEAWRLQRANRLTAVAGYEPGTKHRVVDVSTRGDDAADTDAAPPSGACLRRAS